MVSAAVLYRQTKADNYQGPGNTEMPEFVPWTSVSGDRGLRTILNKQVRICLHLLL